MKQQSLALIRAQLGMGGVESPGSSAESQEAAGRLVGDEAALEATLVEVRLEAPRCAKCGALEMVWLAELEPTVDWIRRRYSHFAFAARGAGFGLPAGFGRPRPP